MLPDQEAMDRKTNTAHSSNPFSLCYKHVFVCVPRYFPSLAALAGNEGLSPPVEK